MATVNAAVHNALRQAGTVPIVINLAAPNLDRSLAARLGRVPRVLRGLVRLAGRRALGRGTLYMSASGGLGQVYELVFLLLARLCGMRVFLHHHSFAYLDEPRLLTRLLLRTAGDHTVHITQSRGMVHRLQHVYRVNRAFAVSNAVFFVNRSLGEVTLRKSIHTLGFISNIAPEKGIFEFLDLMAAAGAAGFPLRGRLAGPFQDADTERAVYEQLRSLSNVEYVGPQYGADKDTFYAGIDVLVFPTRYYNETEGIVNHEAMSRGIPVIAYGRGCIPEIVGFDCGLVIDPSEPFVPAALAQLGRWLADPAAFRAASKAAATRFASTYNENEACWRALLADIVGTPEPTGDSGRERS
jgi:glycosyltransferase involved in cell wall biosynthesis